MINGHLHMIDTYHNKRLVVIRSFDSACFALMIFNQVFYCVYAISYNCSRMLLRDSDHLIVVYGKPMSYTIKVSFNQELTHNLSDFCVGRFEILIVCDTSIHALAIVAIVRFNYHRIPKFMRGR